MKLRVLLIAAMAQLCIATLHAQNITGRWAVDEEFINMMELDSQQGKVDIVLDVQKKTMAIDVLMKMDNEGTMIDLVYRVPGTYTKSRKTVAASFDTTKAEMKVLDIATDDPEMSELMKTKEGKDALIALFNSLLNSQLGEAMKEMSQVTTIFQEFTIVEATGDRLSISAAEETPVSFHRVP